MLVLVELGEEPRVGGLRGKAAKLVGAHRGIQGREPVLRYPQRDLIDGGDGEAEGEEKQ